MKKMMSSSILISIILVLLIMNKSTLCSLAVKHNLTFDCVPREKNALLRFKASFSDDPSNNMLSSWDTDKVCCNWIGVACDDAIGHVVGLHLRNKDIRNGFPSPEMKPRGNVLDSSLLELKHLIYLDLSGNDFQLSPIPSFLGSMKQLQYLNLSHASFNGTVPHQLGNLSSLRTLDLGNNDEYGKLIVDDLMWVTNLSSLEYLDMSGVNLSATKDLVKVLTMLPSLMELRLLSCELDNTNLARTSCVNSTLFTNFQHLDLSFNSFGENSSFCFLRNMTWLSFLDLSHASLHHKADWISDFLWDKCHLKSLNLRGSQFYGDISRAFKNLTGCASYELENLYLDQNKFIGHLPEELGELKQLTNLDVSYNMLSGPIPSSIGNLRALRVLDLSFNQLSGEIPVSLGQLSALERIDIRNNSFEGTLSEAHFAKHSKLEYIDVSSNNMLRFRVIYDWVSPFHHLKYLKMGYVEIEGQFPQWLETQKALVLLDLGSCSIKGTLPKWLGSLMNLTTLDLSDNQIEGPISELPSSITWLDLSDNMITNHLPTNIGHMMPHLRYLLLARNFVDGSIPESLCQMKSLEVLDLSKNHLSGNLPGCDWGNLDSLRVAILSTNQISGPIPSSIGGGTYCMLQWLQLNNNSLTGQLPASLKNCMTLCVLDVGDNKLSGKLPEWIASNGLRFLGVLRLRNNKFYGDIPSAYCQLTGVRILDLAHNQLTGNIPHCIDGFLSMIKDGKIIAAGLFTEGSLSEVIKGVMMEYTTTQYLVNLDLSNNHLFGEIPFELTNLTALIGLNLSHNHLGGQIPRKIGDMSSLESIDLSSNDFHGTIPRSLSKLTFLSHLNLSNNDLSGQIPTGPQLRTLNNLSYDGNPGLCGDPLPMKCHVNNNEISESRKVENDDGDMIIDKIYRYAFIVSGLVTGFWGYFGVLVFKRSWRLALFRRMDALIDKILGRY